MDSIVDYSLLAFCAVFVLIWVLRPLALRWDHVDHPGGRKLHGRSIPLCGGLAIVPVVIAFGLLFSDYSGMWGLAGGLSTLLVLGVIDDRVHIRATIRLLVEVLAVLLFMCLLSDVVLYSLGALLGGDRPVLTGDWALLLTVFAAVSLLNGINMIDGVDGLAGGFAFLVLGIFVTAAALAGSPALGILAFTAAAVAAFLTFNLRTPWRRKASVFLGDAGSLTLGFVLVWFAVDLSQGEAAVLQPITMVWIFGLPIADTIYLFLRRMLRGESPFKADLFHFHHLLLSLGLTPGRVTALWLAAAAACAAIGIAGEVYRVAEVAMFAGYGFVFLAYFVGSTVAWRRLEPGKAGTAEIAGN